MLPGVSHLVYPHGDRAFDPSPRNTLTSTTGTVIAVSEEAPRTPGPQSVGPSGANAGLPFDEEAKLVYGVVLSLRNMIKKLSGK